MNITFIGLGVMGYPMAGHLSRAGLNVTVWNRTPEKADRWARDYTGTAAASIKEAVANADLVMTCVGNDQDVLSVYLDDHGIIRHCPRGCLLIDHTTASAGLAEHLHSEAASAGCDFMDAPVSGGEQGAINGRLTIMCGGESVAFERARKVLDHYGAAVTLLGSVGSGQKTKMVNQIAVAGLLQGLAEALNFAVKSGLDAKQVVDVISKGAAQSWQMENRSATMLDGHFDHGFAVDWMRKDLDICLSTARKLGVTLPVTALVDQFYGDLQAMGKGRWDTSSLIARLERPDRATDQ